MAGKRADLGQRGEGSSSAVPLADDACDDSQGGLAERGAVHPMVARLLSSALTARKSASKQGQDHRLQARTDNLRRTRASAGISSGDLIQRVLAAHQRQSGKHGGSPGSTDPVPTNRLRAVQSEVPEPRSDAGFTDNGDIAAARQIKAFGRASEVDLGVVSPPATLRACMRAKGDAGVHPSPEIRGNAVDPLDATPDGKLDVGDHCVMNASKERWLAECEEDSRQEIPATPSDCGVQQDGAKLGSLPRNTDCNGGSVIQLQGSVPSFFPPVFYTKSAPVTDRK